MKAIKLFIITATAFVVIGAFVDTIKQANGTKTPQPVEKPDPLRTAEYGCELWTRTHSKLRVEEVLGRYPLAGKAPEGRYRVGLDYRAGTSGLMMHSRCEYQDLGHGKQLLLRGTSGL